MKRFGLPVLPSIVVALALGVAPACQADRGGEASGDPTTEAPTTSASTPEKKPAKPRVAKRLRPAPTDCTGPEPRLTGFGDYGNLAGSAPVWAGFYAAFDRAGQRYRIERGAPRTAYGWRIKVLWVVGSKLQQPARIEARELRTDAGLWFEVGEEAAAPAPAGVLDPTDPGVPPTGSGYKEFPSYVYVPRAGCYELEVDWVEGRWRLVLGLGR